jgi:RNA polymerase sigma factor (sigma-70 family)
VLIHNSNNVEVLTKDIRPLENISSTCSDKLLWDALRSGDKKALDLIFENYISLLQWYGERITKNQAIVDDSIQELFIELWNKKALLSSTGSIKFYLFKCLRRRIVRKVRSESWRRGIGLWWGTSDADFDFSRESAIIEEEVYDAKQKYIKNVISRLSKRQQEIIYLKFYEGLSASQIAEVMHLTVPSVYSLIGKSFALLRKTKRYPVG